MYIIIISISLATSGFSIIALLLLILQKRTETLIASKLAKILLIILILLQSIQSLSIAHYIQLSHFSTFYLFLCALVSPVFYLFTQHILHTQQQWHNTNILHFLPALIFALMDYFYPNAFHWYYALIFLLGGFYMLKLAHLLFQIRAQRSLFKMEFLVLSGFLSWAIVVILIGLFASQAMTFLLPAQVLMLSLAIIVALHIQLNYPHLLSSLEEINNHQYQTSTLQNIDCEQIKTQLQQLMVQEKIYQDSDLSLNSTAQQLALKPYQLSELLNTQLQLSFSSYLRQHRIKAAEKLLLNEPKSSVLAIGLTVGFNSQSAFYSAFKECHHCAPGQYRRKKTK